MSNTNTNINKVNNNEREDRELQSLLDLMVEAPEESDEEMTVQPSESTVVEEPVEEPVEEETPPEEPERESPQDVVTEVPVDENAGPTPDSPEEPEREDPENVVTEVPVLEEDTPTDTEETTEADTAIALATEEEETTEETPADTEEETVEEEEATASPTNTGSSEEETVEKLYNATASPTNSGSASASASSSSSSSGYSAGISSTESGSETGAPDYNFTYAEPQVSLNVLVFGSDPIYKSMRSVGKKYLIYTDGEVLVNIEQTSSDDYSKVRSDIAREVSDYDLYVVNPVQAGTANIIDSFADLEDIVDDGEFWNDILPMYKDNILKFMNTIKLAPIDGDVLTMYYRSDILEHFDLSVPKTWNEYSQVAAAVNGEMYNGTAIVGSCVPRRKGCTGYLWTNLILSSMTQYQGTQSGFLFDPYTMAPLTGEAMAETLLELETQVLNGDDNEFFQCDTVSAMATIKWITEGDCALTYSWGSVFKSQNDEGSVVSGLISAAPTPGSLYVLDRTSNSLVRCTEELCGQYGYYDKELGWINQAPYTAVGGWGGAIPKNINKDNVEEVAKFLMYASDTPEKASDAYRIIHDPYRESQLNAGSYEGIPTEEVEEYFQVVQSSLDSGNGVLDLRFSEARDISTAYESAVTQHLEEVKMRGTTSSKEERMAVVVQIDDALNRIIDFHDTYSEVKASTKYQQSLNLVTDSGDIVEGNPSSFGSVGVRSTMSFIGADNAWMSISVCIFCLFFMSLR